MIIEFENCSLEIGHIGTVQQIAIQILSETVESFFDALKSLAEAFVKVGEIIATAIIQAANIVAPCLVKPPAFYGLHRI
jgi:hypothetical protein